MRQPTYPLIRILVPVSLAVLLIASVSCGQGGTLPSGISPTTTVSSVAPTSTQAYSLFQLEYIILAAYDTAFWCDPDIYPVSQTGQEENNAIQQFPTIMANTAEFSAILDHISLPSMSVYTDADKLNIYREHKKLNFAAQMIATNNFYTFSIRVGQGQGQRIEGTITGSGTITVTKQEPSFNTCPICLAKGTLIDTPSGPVPVEQLRQGMMVWTMDNLGKRLTAPIIKTAITPVPSSFQVVKVRLNDGRTVVASPGHPTADWVALADYQIGDTLDGGKVISVEYIDYDGGATYDILLQSTSSLYWANGILLRSTLQ